MALGVVDGHAADEVDHPPEAGQVDRRVVVDRHAEQVADLACTSEVTGPVRELLRDALRAQVMNELILPLNVRPL